MERAEPVTDHPSTLKCSCCGVQQPRQGFRDGICGECGPQSLRDVPEDAIREALWFALGGRGVRKSTRQLIRQILADGAI